MRILAFICLSLAMVIFASCRSEDSATEDSTEEVSTGNEDSSETVNMPWTFLTDGIYHNDMTVTVGQDPKTNPYEGHWIDFHSNGKYDYGIWGEKTSSGSWFYDNESTLLELTPSDGQKRSEWRIMHKDRTLIMQGTPRFQNNAQQIRYIKHDGLPTEE